jgi:hypothetical protein
MYYHNVLNQTHLNPAYIQEKRFEIDPMSMGYHANNSGYKLFDFIDKGSENQNVFNLQKFSKALNGDYLPIGNFSLHTFDFGVKLNKLCFNIGHYFRLEANANIDQELIDVLANGNASYIGKTVNVSPQIYFNSFQAYYLGAAYNAGSLKIGAKIKWLNGNYNFDLQSDNLTLKTGNEFYEIEGQTNFKIKQSGIIAFNENKITKININDTFSFKPFTPNKGFAFDIGLDYQASRSLNLLFNVRDIGSINWSSDSTMIYESKKNIRLNGVDIEAIIDGESTEAVEDSINAALKIEKIGDNYQQKINPAISAGINLDDGKMNYLLAWTFTKVHKRSLQSISLQVTRKINKILNLGLSYNIHNNAFSNLGMMAHLKLNGFHIYGNTENILTLFRPKDLHNISARIGVAFKFDSLTKKEKSI